MRWWDLLDVLLVWMIVYRVLLLVRRSGAVQMLSGLGILAITYILSIWAELYTFNWLLETFFSNLFLIVVILFQGEIRLALAHIGSTPLLGLSTTVEETHIVEEIVKAAHSLAQNGCGALIAIEREISLDYHVEQGVEMGSKVTAELIVSIFQTTSPLHDGAILIRDGRLHSAGSFLPLSKNPILDKNLGTRHRAALGLSEETDAIIVIVSEENQSISLVQDGHLTPAMDMGELRKALYSYLKLKMKGVTA